MSKCNDCIHNNICCKLRNFDIERYIKENNDICPNYKVSMKYIVINLNEGCMRNLALAETLEKAQKVMCDDFYSYLKDHCIDDEFIDSIKKDVKETGYYEDQSIGINSLGAWSTYHHINNDWKIIELNDTYYQQGINICEITEVR